ncbi:SPOR domain-containing protein [Solimonas terrae]|uniref:SPOR domain-containing protein n=1 Tax=Solimonas terrae TaxID=1396819 RepID=A0A6M2BX40_9GAMM|nr:SPOR domain-containing protein [Solimonas terrae]NGY06457.1 hypothetical protein [Solimonas terrae]
MSRDYAPRGGGNRRQTRKSKSKNSGVPGWIWLIAGLSFGLAVAAFVYIRQPASAPMLTQADNDAPAASEAAKGGHEKGGKSQALPLPPKEKERFTFYEILKNQEVVLPNDAVKSSKPPDVAAPSNPATPAPASAANGNDGNTGSYIIQVASYRSQNEAEKQKASLALLGVESRIESVTIDGKDTFYRVRIGPDSNWSHVQTTMSRLEASGIQALLVKIN